jgi:hypothetical protein
MNEANRKQRNADRIKECYPTFATRLKLVISDLENEGFRPRIQDAHRSIADQLEAFEKGHSKVKFGFHNVTGANGRPESLAVDLLDDDHPLDPPRKYLLCLAALVQKHGLNTGIYFGLPAALRVGLKAAIDSGDFSPGIKIGWDPTHIEPTGITIAQARGRKRPT